MNKPVGASLFQVKTDEAMEVHGVWCKWIQEDSETEFLIASTKTAAYKAAFTKEIRNMKAASDPKWSETVAGQIASEEAQIKSMAKMILLDWRGEVFLEAPPAGQPPRSEHYSYSNAIKALSIRAFREWVLVMANREEIYQTQEDAADEAAIKSSLTVEPQVPPAT